MRVVGSEPALAARLMQIANSAALNFTGKPINDLRTAINRMGHNMVRSAAIAFAMSQLKKVDSLKGLEKPLDEPVEEQRRRGGDVTCCCEALQQGQSGHRACSPACCTASASSTF